MQAKPTNGSILSTNLLITIRSMDLMADGSTLALKIATSTVADGTFVKITIFHIESHIKTKILY